MNKNRKRNVWIVIASFFGIFGFILLFIILFLSKFPFIHTKNLQDASQLGSYIGGLVGIFWSGAGAILIYAIFKEQQKQNIKQNFETSFFNLTDSFRTLVFNTEIKSIVNMERYTTPKGQEQQNIITKRGIDFFSHVLKEVKSLDYTSSFLQSICRNRDIPEIKTFLDDLDTKNKNSDIVVNPESQIEFYGKKAFLIGTRSKEFIIAYYEYVYNKYQSKLGHYFRFLYNIFKFTIEERLEYEDENKYINIIQAQMSNDELGLLFYNVLSKYGKTIDGTKKFYDWLNKYNFLENIDPDSIIDKEHHWYYSTIFKFLSAEEKQTKIKKINKDKYCCS